MGRIFSPGKLMLTSEYVALDGALVLAVPTKYGQDFFYEETDDFKAVIYWEAYHQEKLWLRCIINYKNWEILETNLPEAAEFVRKVLKSVQQLSSEKLKGNISYHLKTNLQFPADFGLGSSSTLINNLAEWSQTDPFDLNEKCLGGSGYDIAVAQQKKPITFKLKQNGREIYTVNFNPKFKDQLIFIHLNQKQDSREGIRLYREKEKLPNLVEKFTEITNNVLQAESVSEFSELMTFHEDLISQFLNLKTAKDLYFRDCPAFIKSLGAWGGDFVMSRKFTGYREYFSQRGFSKIFSWSELIL